MKDSRASLAWLWLACTGLLCAGPVAAKPPVVASALKDGLKLTVSPLDAATGAGGSFICKMENTLSEAVPFDDTGLASGFYFQLFNENGDLIMMDELWERRNSPGAPYAVERTKHSLTWIKPGKIYDFTLKLDEAYGDRWKVGGRLLVEWTPGLIGPTDAPMTIGRGLKTEVKIEPLKKPSSIPEASTSPSDPAPSAKPAPLKATGPNPEPSTGVPTTVRSFWPLWASAAAVLAVVLWWWRKNRRREAE